MADKPKLLAGDNPQIPKGEGDAPVQFYIQAIPGWKRDVARKVDTLISQTVPDVQKAVKWNSPLYGMDGKTWFASFHCFTKYLKIAFHNGAALVPEPPVPSKQAKVRYLHIYEGEVFDEGQFKDWISQASKLPGEKM
ncbi:DUF1801 domain-containing protein [Limoniibacter endophyticus]|uniref:YdhG-like domain-containing protein n=1 Tax=Limoniibacter endophyticus TaxID=1565040 RepID=A0A8J3DS36_9HYPH|nr:DUF1801 domain-containing protein [Limoniibacter endophyticus]GHC78750.1 hypothetical protein GCM10010136_30740 [Limoniibacter endophyticus]